MSQMRKKSPFLYLLYLSRLSPNPILLILGKNMSQGIWNSPPYPVLYVHTRDHSFLQCAEFWAELQNLPVCVEFLHFRRILRNSVMAGGKGKKCSIFWLGLGGRGKLITTCRHDCTIKYMTASWVLTWGILKILNLSEILNLYLVDRLYLSVAVTYRRQILHIWLVSQVVEN